MKPLTPPSHTTSHVYNTCISTVADVTEKAQFASIGPEVATAALAFEQAVRSLSLHQLQKATPTAAPLSDAKLLSLYEYRMRNKKNVAGRAIYDAILVSAPGGACPLCSVGFTSTLDHYAPQSVHPMLAVVPLNLVPVCGDCNREKLDTVPASSQEHTLHPYFDNVDGSIWLTAAVQHTTPASFKFSVVPPAGWNAVTAARVQHHFDSFGLDRKFAASAANELTGIRFALESIYTHAGAQAVQAHLAGQAASWTAGSSNCWQAALYAAAAGDAWFCGGGFR